MTMATSTAATISQRCSSHTTTTHQDSSTISELIVSKADNCGIGNHSYHPSKILREIPTRISQLSSTAAAADPDDDDDRRQPEPFFTSLSINLDESPNLPQSRPSSSNTIDSIDKLLDDLDAIATTIRWPVPLNSNDPTCAVKDDAQQLPQPRPSSCNEVVSIDKLLADIAATNAKMTQRWPLPINSTNPNCIVNDDMQYLDDNPPPAPSSLPPLTTTLETEDAPYTPLDKLDDFTESFIKNTQNIIKISAQNSQALSILITKFDELSALMTRLEHVVDTLVTDKPPHCYAPVPVHHPTATNKPKIPSTPTPVPELQQLPCSPHCYHNNLHRPTAASPWPPPPLALFPNPAKKLKPPTRIKKVLAKSSVVRGCLGMSRTKDNLRPP